MVVRLKRNDYRPPALQHRFRAEGDLLPAKKKIAFRTSQKNELRH